VVGALLAIPVAGMNQVIVRNVWGHRRGRLKEEPTVGSSAGRRSPPDGGGAGTPTPLPPPAAHGAPTSPS
jgi:hypothetical protein